MTEKWQITRLVERLKNAKVLQYQLFAVVNDSGYKLVYRLSQHGSVVRLMDEAAITQWINVYADYGLVGFTDGNGLVCFVFDVSMKPEEIEVLINTLNGAVLKPNCDRSILRDAI